MRECGADAAPARAILAKLGAVAPGALQPVRPPLREYVLPTNGDTIRPPVITVIHISISEERLTHFEPLRHIMSAAVTAPGAPSSKLSDTQFDAELTKDLVRFVRGRRGCFACGAAGAKQVCSACGLATYCNKSCAKLDWKGRGASSQGTHKEICEVWNENRGVHTHALGDDGGGFPTALNLRGLGLLNDAEMDDAMAAREALFLLHLAKRHQGVGGVVLLQMSANPKGRGVFHVQMSTIFTLGAVRLAVNATFWDATLGSVQTVERLLLAAIDRGESAKALIGVPPAGGELSLAGFAQACSTLEAFAERWRAAGCVLASATLGRGLAQHAQSETFRAKIGAGAYPVDAVYGAGA